MGVAIDSRIVSNCMGIQAHHAIRRMGNEEERVAIAKGTDDRKRLLLLALDTNPAVIGKVVGNRNSDETVLTVAATTILKGKGRWTLYRDAAMQIAVNPNGGRALVTIAACNRREISRVIESNPGASDELRRSMRDRLNSGIAGLFRRHGN